MFDLLNKKSRLRILENAQHEVQIVGLKEEPVYDLSDVLRLISSGNSCRYCQASNILKILRTPCQIYGGSEDILIVLPAMQPPIHSSGAYSRTANRGHSK